MSCLFLFMLPLLLLPPLQLTNFLLFPFFLPLDSCSHSPLSSHPSSLPHNPISFFSPSSSSLLSSSQDSQAMNSIEISPINPTIDLQGPVNTHPMVTCSKVGIYKLKILLADCGVSSELDLFKPTTYNQATRHAHWLAMDTEF